MLASPPKPNQVKEEQNEILLAMLLGGPEGADIYLEVQEGSVAWCTDPETEDEFQVQPGNVLWDFTGPVQEEALLDEAPGDGAGKAIKFALTAASTVLVAGEMQKVSDLCDKHKDIEIWSHTVVWGTNRKKEEAWCVKATDPYWIVVPAATAKHGDKAKIFTAGMGAPRMQEQWLVQSPKVQFVWELHDVGKGSGRFVPLRHVAVWAGKETSTKRLVFGRAPPMKKRKAEPEDEHM